MRIGITHRSPPHRQLVNTDGVDVYKTVILASDPDDFPAPTASLIEQLPHDVIRPHFHFNSQFQVFVNGSGKLGRADVRGFVVQYVSPHTGYGPITASEDGIWYLTLRPSFPTKKPGYKPVLYLPESRPVLASDSKKFQVHSEICDVVGERAERTFVKEVIAPAESGLAAWWLRIPANEVRNPPELAGGLARYHLVANGSLIRDGTELPTLSVIWTEGAETLQLVAGDTGADVIVMQFPGDAF